MARLIVVNHGGTDSQFAFKKLDRAKLYGRRRRIVMDPTGQPCERAELTDDGETLLRVGMSAQGYFDEHDRWIPSRDLVGLDSEGDPVPVIPSTLGVSQPLEGPMALDALLDTKIKAVYLLDPVDLDEGLNAALEAGDVFQFQFNYRTDYRPDVGFLVGNDDGLFALIGQPVTPEWCELEQLGPQDFSDEDELDDDLDFEMF